MFGLELSEITVHTEKYVLWYYHMPLYFRNSMKYIYIILVEMECR
jgi:hypothetical protein